MLWAAQQHKHLMHPDITACQFVQMQITLQLGEEVNSAADRLGDCGADTANPTDTANTVRVSEFESSCC
jgi:hypothetical protein